MDSSRSTSRWMVTSSTLSMRWDRPANDAAGALEGALPLAHGGDEHRGHAGGRPVAEHAVELLQRLAGPEHLLEVVHRLAGAREQQRLVDDDRPAPDRGGEQAEHHELDDEMRAPEHRPERDLGRDRSPRPWVITSVGFIGKDPFVLRPGPIRAACPGAQLMCLPEKAMATGSLRLSRLSHPGIRRNKGVDAMDAVPPGRFGNSTR